VKQRTYRAFFAFCGSGPGALGFQESRGRLFGTEAQFEVIGGIDIDRHACNDFEYLTGVPAWCANVEDITPQDVIDRYGAIGPDVVVITAPCKGASSLLSKEKARTEKYRRLNRLALRWVERMIEAWGSAPPKLVLFENVPRLKTRAGGMLRRIRSALHRAGYRFVDGNYECGELGGLAQIRRRFLMVARHEKTCPPLLYQPPKLRVRGCGEVLGPLPMPGDPAGGPMHTLPKLSWLNWVRLALIPAGGDWRDLNGVLADGQPRREVFKRHGVQRWEDPSQTVAGSGSNGPSAVADPRAAKLGQHHNKMRVERWEQPAHTVTGSDRVGSGAPSVADPRLAALAVGKAFDHGYGVLRFDEPSPTVAAGSHPGQGAYAVADPRPNNFTPYGVLDWSEPSEVVTGRATPSTGRFTVADPRLNCTPRTGAYGVTDWQDPSKAVTGAANVDNGAFAVADPRIPPTFVVMTIDEALALDLDPKKPPPFIPVIVAADGTWHRPLTTLELAVLQSFPAIHRGKPLVLSGSSVSLWREHIGNAAPRLAFKAIGDQMLMTLLESEFGGFSLRSDHTPVWVEQEQAVMQ
jgi:site-specific DNA-cytosine methylase